MCQCWSFFFHHFESHSRTCSSVRDLNNHITPGKQCLSSAWIQQWAPATNIWKALLSLKNTGHICYKTCKERVQIVPLILFPELEDIYSPCLHISLQWWCSPAACRRQTFKQILLISNILLSHLPSPWGSNNIFKRAKALWHALVFSQ